MNEPSDLRKRIVTTALVFNKDEHIAGYSHPEDWIFDLKRLSLRGNDAVELARALAGVLPKNSLYQLGTLETSGIPLVTSLLHELRERGNKSASAFFVRKSRKKEGLMHDIEGPIDETLPVVLIDDILNSGDSLWKAVITLEQKGLHVASICTVLRYREMSHYQRFIDKGIVIRELYSLSDLTDMVRAQYGVTLQNLESSAPPSPPFAIHWRCSLPGAAHEYVLQKSKPALDTHRVYFGSDDHAFYALNKYDGSIAWRFPLRISSGKSIFSNPVVVDDLVIFGAYDGNIYALFKNDGELCWKFAHADWVGSSPAVSTAHGTVFIGLEYGLFRKHGGIACLDAKTGDLIWKNGHPSFTHSSPLYIPHHDQVIIGSNDGIVRLYDAATGSLRWSFATYGSSRFNPHLHSGFGEGDIKESFVYDPARDQLSFGSIDGHLYILDRKSGDLIFAFQCDSGIFSTPVVHDDHLYFTSTDKYVRALSLETHELRFATMPDGTRIFADPLIYENDLIVGTNGGRLCVLDPKSGSGKGFLQLSERITNGVVSDHATRRFFARTNANEIVCIERIDDHKKENVQPV